MTNKYTYSVPFTEEELYQSYVIEGLSQAETAKKLKVSQKVVWRAMKKMNIPSRRAVARNQKGEANNNWKGGRVLVAMAAKRPSYSDRGYFYLYAPEHPNANKSGYVAEHIKIATEKEGRALRKGEVVHHVDLNKHNNTSGNLAIANRQKHATWHQQLQEAAIELYHEGYITFDEVNGYRRVK